VNTSTYLVKNKALLSTSKRVVILTSGLILALLVWQTYSAYQIHQRYQKSLMEAVTTQILSDYQKYFNQLRLKIDLFQQKHLNAIEKLHSDGKKALIDDYMPVLETLRTEIKESNLFALIGKNGQGSLQHITGDFLPDCKTEIATIVKAGTQNQLFLHRSEKSVHFDLLQPLTSTSGKGEYFFVSFKPTVFTEILKKYQLPHQQLFLMRSDHIGQIELSTESGDKNQTSVSMNKEEIKNFDFIRDIPNTRWQLAIRLDPKYNQSLFIQGLTKALIIWILLTTLIYAFYRQQKNRIKKNYQMMQELAFKDNHDQLTGLANRTNFERHLVSYIETNFKSKSHGNGVVIHIDIDKFQVINNSYGYAAGDKFLYQVSLKLIDFLPKDTIISRLGNDEFALLLPSLDHQHAKECAHSIRLLIQNIHIFELSEETTITASIGVLMLDKSIVNTEQVFASLAQAVRLAKNKGRNRVQIYQSDDQQLVQHATEMEAINKVSRALKEKRFVLYRQQIKSLQTQEPAHYEILVRMISSEGNLIPPLEFIPAAEKHGIIRQIDHWVIEHTFKMIASQPEDTDTDYSINLSGATIADRDIYDVVIALFKRYKVDPQRICFEITETSAITHLKSALHFIESMIEYGCYFSLDDFGSGLSSFSYLQQLPIHIIKIDGVFIRDMDTNPVNRIFVENIQRTATAMNKKIVAEFVENAEIEMLLTVMGIDYGQGYHIHKPEPWYDQSVK